MIYLFMVILCVFVNTFFFKYRQNIKYMPFCVFKYTKFMYSNIYLNPTLVPQWILNGVSDVGANSVCRVMPKSIGPLAH